MNGKFSNVKKVLATLVCAFMLIQCAALGVLAYDISPEAVVYVRPEIVEVTANQIGKNYIYVDVVAEGAGNDQPVIAYLITESGKLITLGYAPVDSNATQIKLGVPDSAPTAEYVIAVTLNQAADVATGSIYYVGVEDVDGFFEAVNMENVEVTAVKEKLDNHYEALSVIASTKDVKLTGAFYQELSNGAKGGKEELAKLILNGVNGKYSDGKGNYNAENSEDFVKEACVVAAYNNGGFSAKKLAEIIYNYSDTIGFDAEDENLYAKIQNRDTFVKVAKTMEDKVNNAEELALVLTQAVCVQIVNETHWLNLVNVIADNNDLFGVRASQIEKLKSKKSLREAFCKAFKGTYYSVDEIRDAWDDAYEKALDQTSSGSTGGSGGGGGGGAVITNKVQTQITDSQNNYDPNVAILDYYTDIAGTKYSWTSEAVLNLTKAGIVSGYGEKIFAPGNSLTRAEFTKMIVNVFGLADITATCSFADVDPDAWYYIYIASAEKYNLAQGYGNGLFGINDPVTRQDAVTLIYRAAKAKGISTEHFYKSGVDLVDKDSIAAYAYPAVEALYNTGVYLDATEPTSVNAFEPTRYATRGYVSFMLNRLYSYMN